MDVAHVSNLVVCQLEDLAVPRKKCRAVDTIVKWKDIKKDVQCRSQGYDKRRKKHENNTEGKEARVRWENSAIGSKNDT